MSITSTQNLTKIFGSGPTAITALDKVNISVNHGEFILIPVLNPLENAALPITLDGVKPAFNTEGHFLVDSFLQGDKWVLTTSPLRILTSIDWRTGSGRMILRQINCDSFFRNYT